VTAEAEAGSSPVRLLRLVTAVLTTARPRQWPKNLLVFAAPLAGATLGRDDGLGYALVAAAGITAGVVISEPLLPASVGGYLGISFLYSGPLKHIPVLELCFVASGFLLRVLGGAAAAHVRPSGWFLLVCSLGAFGVAVARRHTELTSSGPKAIAHRPAMSRYRAGAPDRGRRCRGYPASRFRSDLGRRLELVDP
jgi:decaprenyl-phosphate phosphoribosyltransferase